MRRRWFPTQPVQEGFFDTAPFRLTEAFDIPRTAAQVWQDLTAENPLSWCKILRGISWTSPRPFGVGTTRTASTIGNTTVINEHFFRWEEGRRQSFYVLESNLPLFRRFAEDYLVEPTSDTACRFTWTIAIEPYLATRPANPTNRLLLSTLFRDTRKHYGLR
jgi:Polyketide cyclase / dehydrase and lipid transport